MTVSKAELDSADKFVQFLKKFIQKQLEDKWTYQCIDKLQAIRYKNKPRITRLKAHAHKEF